ncbi:MULTISPECIES: hypothetical protein [unclassified Microcoleus]|uniref:hypothetical protein n=1 Tax=unclassified Microcoleus TaxID=2642155 RepID=UPI002FD2E6BC
MIHIKYGNIGIIHECERLARKHRSRASRSHCTPKIIIPMLAKTISHLRNVGGKLRSLKLQKQNPPLRVSSEN